MNVFCSAAYCVVLALRNLENDSKTSKEVREKATGALWILENREKPQNRPKSAKRGQYTIHMHCQ